MASNTKQHYVPQFLLRGFGAGNRNQLTAFDKHQGREFKTSVRDAAGERSFYDFTFKDGIASLESALAEIEDKASPILYEIRNGQTLAGIHPHERSVVATFVAIQLVRTPNFRTSMREVSDEVAKHLREFDRVEEPQVVYPELDDEGARLLSLKMLADAPKYAPLLEVKSWILFRNLTPIPFMVSDNPVTLQNQRPDKLRGNLGLGVPGIEIYLPLNSELTLSMICPSYESASRFGLAAAAVDPKLARAKGIDVTGLRQILTGMESGTPVECSPEHVMNLNSLQVRHAERFLYAANNKPFELAKEMISDDDGYRSGPRISVE